MMTIRSCILIAATFASSLLMVVASAASGGASQTSDATGQLATWQGRWSYSEIDYETKYSHAHTNSGTAECSWAPNRGFIICDYLNRSPGNGVPANDLGIFIYNPVAKTYTRLGVFKDGTTFSEKMAVQGNTWTTSSEFPYHNKTLKHRTVYSNSSDIKRTAVSQLSDDNGRTWTTTSEFVATRT